MDWKLGVAMSASSCRALNCPYVSVRLTLASGPGKTRTHTIDMTIPEFQVGWLLASAYLSLSLLSSLSLMLTELC